MENLNCENGGCIITWRIENPFCLENHSSPVFNIEANQKTQWKLRLSKFAVLNVYLSRTCSNDDLSPTISYSYFFKTDYEQTQVKTGVVTAEKSESHLCTIDPMRNNYIPKHITFHCYLRVLENINFLTNQYIFRSVVPAKHLAFKHTIPNKGALKLSEKLNVPLPITNNEREPFEINLFPSNSDGFQFASVEFCNKNEKNYQFFLWCKLRVFDGRNDCIQTEICSHNFIIPNEKWLFPKPICLKTVNQNSMKEVLTLDFELLVPEQETVLTWMESFKAVTNRQMKSTSEKLEKEKANLRDDLLCLYVERKCPDVEICVGDKKFPAHKAILCARSPVFLAMFENNMLEKVKNMVEISDLDSETVDRMLFFMYSEIMQVQDWNFVTKLYVAADKYQIMSLKDKCSSVLKEQLSLKNVCEALHLADMHCDSDFLRAIQVFVIANEEKVFKSEEWKEFMNSNSKVACQIMYNAWLNRFKNLYVT